jgi:hypothetical protein
MPIKLKRLRNSWGLSGIKTHGYFKSDKPCCGECQD